MGIATLIPGFGQLVDRVQAPLTRRFEVVDGEVRMNDRVRFPARPMVGVVGVATEGETLSNGLAGRHGGNLDDHLHGPGARMFFPVRQPGGMFAVGDMHASMGDGEVCFTGVEIAGEVDIRFDVFTGAGDVARDRVADRWLPHATAATFEESLALVAEEAGRCSSISGASRSRTRLSSCRWRATPALPRPASRHRAGSGRSPVLDPQDLRDPDAV